MPRTQTVFKSPFLNATYRQYSRGLLRKLYDFSLLRHKGNRLISLWHCAGRAFKATHYPGASFSTWPCAQVRSCALQGKLSLQLGKSSWVLTLEAWPSGASCIPEIPIFVPICDSFWWLCLGCSLVWSRQCRQFFAQHRGCSSASLPHGGLPASLCWG